MANNNKNKKNNSASKKVFETKINKKKKRKNQVMGLLAVVLALMMILTAIMPVFAETNVTVTTRPTVAADLQSMIDLIESEYYQDIDESLLIEGAYEGMMETLDPHSTYFSDEEYTDFVTSLSGEFSGIGAYIGANEAGNVEIVSPIANTPADSAGLKSGDEIIEINGTSAVGWTVEKAAATIRGEKGTEVQLGIKRLGTSETLYFNIVRDVIVVTTVASEILENNIGYIQVTQFGEKTTEEFDQAMAKMETAGVQQLIVDVRNNPGGYLSTAIDLSDYFVESGKLIVKEKFNDGQYQSFRASKDPVNMTVAVLVNEGSASASEIFAGSIKETGAGTVIGVQTYGKGTVQTMYDMQNAGAIKLTIAEYLLYNDYKVDGNGINPDIIVELPQVEDYNAYNTLVPMSEKSSKYRGDTSLNVYGAQQRLNLLGETLTVDGVFGGKTEAALKKFQLENGLKANGVLNSVTVQKLNDKMEMQFGDNTDLQLQEAIAFLNNK